ncbi:MAG: hypothetical protein KF740_06740 [Ramlibacter sp.]|nr:hypothetical protein [Ramlibacter sp.]
MDRFSGFSPESFEQLIRALALKIIGPGLTAFGDGPDGGREATFSGEIPYPYPPVTTWNGYGVIQAKFKTKTEGTAKDQAWAEGQLRKELELWATVSKRVPKPDYFIFCTNVSLSSASDGGKDALSSLLENPKYGLKGHALWDANQLAPYISADSDVRKNFCHFFTPGDLLAEFSKSLSLSHADPEAVLSGFITRELVSDEDARLGQAGDRSEDRVRLAQVFVDLPSKAEAQEIYEEDHRTETGEELIEPASLVELMRAASRKLDPKTLYDERMQNAEADPKPEALSGRFVFLGGPGSGKSTIGQFFAQIHRAALLNRKPAHRLEPNVLEIIEAIKDKCANDGYGWPATPRYPFRIELNAFAKALATKTESRITSLSEYLRRQLSKTTEVQHVELRQWLAAYPWLLIFDGLDEVPISSNRKDVILAIQEFLNEARDAEADLMIVASSRPDGYLGEFEGAEVAHRYLLPLSKPRALLCASKYVNAKVAPKDDRRATEAMDTLRSAVDNPLVARLMHSPLQVTFMVTVVAASGKPSESRWQLFSDYYRTIYERELHKAVPPFAKALNERRSDIDALHHRVGFLLQLRAESSGGTQADLGVDEFENVVEECLLENGLSEQELAEQKGMIIGAANQRLVFLTSRTPGRLSFDVRSLQEYMAAACITNVDSGDAIRRLELIAHSAFWRNVVLFAVGRFFADAHMRSNRDKVRVLCDDLGRRSTAHFDAKAGARLALDILVSGVLGRMPLAYRSLVKTALELLDFAPPSEDSNVPRLAAILKDECVPEFQEALRLRLGQVDISRALSAWVLIKLLTDKGITWANDLIEEFWPKTLPSARQVLKAWTLSMQGKQRLSNVATDKFCLTIPQLKPTEALELLLAVTTESSMKPWLNALVVLLGLESTKSFKIHAEGKFVGLSVHVKMLSDKEWPQLMAQLEGMLSEPNCHDAWTPISALARFAESPSIVSLGRVRDSVNLHDEDRIFWPRISPWPVCQVLLEPNIELNAEDSDGWDSAEMSAQAGGLVLDSLLSSIGGCSTISVTGIRAWTIGQPDKGVRAVFPSRVLGKLDDSLEDKSRNVLISLLAWTASHFEVLNILDPSDVGRKILNVNIPWNWQSNSFLLKHSKTDEVADEWIDFFDRVGSGKITPVTQATTPTRAHAFWLLSKYLAHPMKKGLLKLAGSNAIGFLNFYGGAVRQEILKFDAEKIDWASLSAEHRLSAVSIQLCKRELPIDTVKRMVGMVNEVLMKEFNASWADVLVRFSERQGHESVWAEPLLTAIYSSVPVSEWATRAEIEKARGGILLASPSGFSLDVLKSLDLPH